MLTFNNLSQFTNMEIFHNNWFRGFLENKGCFLYKIIGNKNWVEYRIFLSNIDICGINNINIMECFSKFFKIHYNEYNYRPYEYVICISNRNNLKLLMEYLDQFPLLSSKNNDYQYFKVNLMKLYKFIN